MEREQILAEALCDQAVEDPRNVMFKGESMTVPDAFWDVDARSVNLGALLKSHADLRRRLSDGGAQAPDIYDLVVPQHLDGRVQIDSADPLAQGAMSWAKKYGLSQDAFSELAGLYFDRLATGVPDHSAELNKLRDQLGDRLDDEMSGLGCWVDGLLGDHFQKTPELLQTAERLAATAEGVLLLKALKDRIGEVGVPTSRGIPGARSLDAAALRALQATDAYQSGDPNVRRQVAEGWSRLYPGDGL